VSRRRRFLTSAAAAAALAAGLAGGQDLAPFHHLAMGRHLATHGLLGPEPFLFMLDGQPAPPPPGWLGALAFFAAHALAGMAGVALLGALAAAAAFGLAADDALRPERPRTVRTRAGVVTVPDLAGEAPAGWRDALAALLPVALALGALRIRAAARPEVLALLAFAWTLHALRHGGRRRLWSLPAVALLWACLHPSVGFGLLALALGLLDALRDVVMAPRDEGGAAARARARQVGLVLLASVALAALAPGGALGVALDAARAVVAGAAADPALAAARAHLRELQPLGPEFLLTPGGLLLPLVPLGWALGWLLGRRRPRFGDTLLLLSLLVAATRSRAFVPFAALAAAPLVARELAAAVRRWLGRQVGQAARGAALGGGLALALAGALAWSAAWPPAPGPTAGRLPVRAADALAEALPRAPQARLWNALPAGGYLEWRLPGAHLAQDERLAWPAGEAQAVLAGPADRTRFTALDARWRFDALVTGPPPRRDGEAPPFDPIADGGRWALVAGDDGGLLYVRRDGALAALAARGHQEAAPGGAPAPERPLDPGRR